MNDPSTLFGLDAIVPTDLHQAIDHMVEGVHIIIVQDDLLHGTGLAHDLLEQGLFRAEMRLHGNVTVAVKLAARGHITSAATLRVVADLCSSMHDIEPFWNWRHKYTAESDERSPFHGREHSELYFTHAVYDHAIHPQWDEIGSETLYLKVLYAEYEEGFAVIEMIGEWNDLLGNDIMFLKRDYIEPMMDQGIRKFILIGENVLNFHSSDEEYYSEWFEEVSDADGWIALLNFRPHVLEDMQHANIDQYFLLGGALNALAWRTAEPEQLYEKVEGMVMRRIG